MCSIYFPNFPICMYYVNVSFTFQMFMSIVLCCVYTAPYIFLVYENLNAYVCNTFSNFQKFYAKGFLLMAMK